MPVEASPEPAGALQHRAVERTRQLLALAQRCFATRIVAPEIRFDLRGQAAGQVRPLRGRAFFIRYNAQLLARNPRDFLNQTVPHEAAHLVAFRLFGPRIKPHGQEWQAIVRLFGAEPERCHSYDVEGLQARRLRRYEYRCACRTHELTSIRHNRIEGGQVYLCRYCGAPLQRSIPRPSSADRPVPDPRSCCC